MMRAWVPIVGVPIVLSCRLLRAPPQLRTVQPVRQVISGGVIDLAQREPVKPGWCKLGLQAAHCPAKKPGKHFLPDVRIRNQRGHYAGNDLCLPADRPQGFPAGQKTCADCPFRALSQRRHTTLPALPNHSESPAASGLNSGRCCRLASPKRSNSVPAPISSTSSSCAIQSS